jgi:hypothetical protein
LLQYLLITITIISPIPQLMIDSSGTDSVPWEGIELA